MSSSIENNNETINSFSEVSSFINHSDITSFSDDTDMIDIITAMLRNTHYDTGFFIVDLSIIINQYNKWITNLPRVKPFYAVKCNPNQNIIKTLAILGAGFDCASKNEIIDVLEAVNNDASRIIFANPAKSDSHLRYARSVDVDLMTFDNEFELYKIKHIHDGAQLVLRIKVNDTFSLCKFNCKFGADMEDVDKLLNIASILELNVIGVSFHVGSGCKSAEAYEIAIRMCKEVFDKAKVKGFNLTILDIGGGFPGTEDENVSVKFEEFATVINKSLDRYFNLEEFPEEYGLRIIGEPGRYFASAASTLVLNVIAKNRKVDKETGIIEYAYTLSDGVYGSFNCIIFDHAKPIVKPYNERDGKLYKSRVYGPSCDSMDTIAIDVQLPDLAIGEYVYLPNFGAYTIAAASTFNGFQKTPCEYIIRQK